MVKKKVNNIYEENKEKVIGILADFLQKGGNSVLDWVKQIFSVKKKIRKLITSTGFILAALVVP